MLYDKVLSEDPSNPHALAYAGFLQWNVGTHRQRAVADAGRAGRDRDGHHGTTRATARPTSSTGSSSRTRITTTPPPWRSSTTSWPTPPRPSELAQAAPLVAGAYKAAGRAAAGPVQRHDSTTTTTTDVSSVATRRSADDPGELAGEGGAVLVGRRPPDADPQRVAGVDAHRLEHRRRLDALRRAGGARVDGDARPVQPDEHRLGLHPVHAEADQRGGASPPGPGPTTSPPRRPSAASTTDAICRRAVAARVRRPAAPLGQRRGRGAEGEEGRQRLEPGAAPALLLPAHEEGVEPAAAPHDQRAGAGHPAELVRADADQVGVERGQVQSARARRPRRRRRGR